MNKKITSQIAIGIILLVAVAVGGAVWVKNKKEPVVENNNVQLQHEQSDNKLNKWLTYSSSIGYSFEYSSDWHCKESLENNKQYGDSCLSSESQKQLDIIEKSDKSDYFVDDLEISILDMSVADYIKDPTIERIGDLSLDGKKAYEVIIGGYLANYGVVSDFKGKTIEIKFQKDSKKNIGESEKNVISTFKFPK